MGIGMMCILKVTEWKKKELNQFADINVKHLF